MKHRGYLMMYQKQKQIRLKGKALAYLIKQVFERDNHCCVVCRRWVEDGVKPHHAYPGYGRKSDELGQMVLLCYECHQAAHFGKNSAEINAKIREYLSGDINARTMETD